MGRKAWSVTNENYSDVYFYLDEIVSESDMDFGKVSNAEELDDYIKTNYMTDEITKMRAAIRMQISRGRKLRAKKKDVSVTLTPKAHKILKELAEAEELTLSEIIVQYGEALLEMPKAKRQKLKA